MISSLNYSKKEYIFEDQDYAFRINLAFGLILRIIENGSYWYFSSANNVRLFQSPILTSKQGMFEKIYSMTGHENNILVLDYWKYRK